jgi:bacteriocin biosynthesis cyclodehydratase domain-containing protein
VQVCLKSLIFNQGDAQRSRFAMMLKRPRLKRFLTIFPISATTWGLRGGDDELWRIRCKDGEAFETFTKVLPFLNGNYNVDDIIDRVAAYGISAEAVLKLLDNMHGGAMIEENDCDQLSEADRREYADQISYFSRYTAQGGAQYQARVLAACVGVIGEGRLSDCLARQLTASGVSNIVRVSEELLITPRHVDANPGGDAGSRNGDRNADLDLLWRESDAQETPSVLIVGQERESPTLLQKMDTLSKRRQVPWMLVRCLESQVAWVGPMFVPGETACFRSLEARLDANRPYFPEYQAFRKHLYANGSQSEKCGGLHASFELVASIAVIEIMKFISGFAAPTLAGRFLTINLTDWTSEVHDVLRIPRISLDSTGSQSHS